MTKKELQDKCELAQLYYMRGETQKSIAIKTGVSETTISKWAEKGKWAIRRAGMNVTRPELVNKTLLAINDILENYSESEDPQKTLDADKLCKLASIIEKLDKKTNIVTIIEITSNFERWLINRSRFDKEVTNEFIQKVNAYQQYYIDDLSVNTD